MLPLQDYKDEAGVTDFIQCTPMLVTNGSAAEIGDVTLNQRTFVIPNQAGRWALGTCRDIRMQELADLLATRGIIGEFTVKEAINLDGGPSTAL